MKEFVKTGHDWRLETQEFLGNKRGGTHEELFCLEITMPESRLDLPGLRHEETISQSWRRRRII